MNYTPKPVTIITGFLGAGKTTFLNEYIRYNKESRPVVIENEFGEEGIDGGLVIAAGSDIFEFNNGCICCNLNEDLFDLLEVLWERKQTFDELVIEATGVADPATVAQPFFTTKELDKYYVVERIICIVDASFIELQLKETEEAKKQIAYADIIVLNKCEGFSGEEFRQLKQLLESLNPFAKVFFGNKSDGYPMERIMSLKRGDFDRKIVSPSVSLKKIIPASASLLAAPQVVRHHNLTSVSFVLEEPFNLTALKHQLMIFLAFETSVYRIKGILSEYGNNNKVIIQSVMDAFSITEGEEWKEDEVKSSRLVFIGKDLKSDEINDLLQECQYQL